MSSKTLVDTLMEKAADSPGAKVGLLETHISWVLLIGDFAYKIKKPVNLGFLDFTSLEQRKHFCEEELRLNRRFSPQLYLDVVAIIGEETSPEMTKDYSADNDVIDYAVKMRRFQQEQLVSTLLKENQLSKKHFEDLGRTLAEIYETLKPIETGNAGTLPAILGPAKDNFTSMVSLTTNTQYCKLLKSLEVWTDKNGSELAPIFSDRKEKGFIKDCHGDLHTGNLAYIDDEFVLFDCIEFSEGFRAHDVICDIAILLMDLEAKGKADLSHRMLYGYLENSGDYDALPLLQFYKLYYAMVRAKVSFIQAQQKEEENEQESAELATKEAEAYLNLGCDYIKPRQPYLLITCGLSGSGKTTVAKQLLDDHGVILLRSDVERKRLFGLGANEHSDACGEDIYTTEASKLTFDNLYETAHCLLASNISILVDGTFLTQNLRQRFMDLAQQLDVGFIIVHCVAKEATLTHRIEERERENSDASEANVTVMKQQQGKFEAFSKEELSHVVEVNTEQAIEAKKLKDLLR